jgi:hypothetical protein
MIVALRDPHVPSSYGVCPFLALTGLYCPGCGSLRALHDLGAGDLAGAFGHHALLVPAIVLLAAWAVWTWLPVPAAERVERVVAAVPVVRRIPWAWTILAVLPVFTVLRNLPGSALAP